MKALARALDLDELVLSLGKNYVAIPGPATTRRMSWSTHNCVVHESASLRTVLCWTWHVRGTDAKLDCGPVAQIRSALAGEKAHVSGDRHN
jgi:hypothetical protein